MRSVVTGYGPAAAEALRAALAELRGDDPLAPVEVAVPLVCTACTRPRR